VLTDAETCPTTLLTFCTFPAEVVSVNLFSFQLSKMGRKKQVGTDGCQQSGDCSWEWVYKNIQLAILCIV